MKDTPQVGARCAEDHIIFHIGRLSSSSSAVNAAASLPLATPEDDIRTTHDAFVDQLNASRQGQSSNAHANAIISLNEYKKRPFQHWKDDPLKFWSQQKMEGVFLPLFPVATKFLCAIMWNVQLCAYSSRKGRW